MSAWRCPEPRTNPRRRPLRAVNNLDSVAGGQHRRLKCCWQITRVFHNPRNRSSVEIVKVRLNARPMAVFQAHLQVE